ncbi:MAG: bifunctional riboflavin kinase/FAD synthetase [bacterium]
MKIFALPVFLPKPTVVTVGSFDGVHLGHQKILSELVMLARSLNLKSVVVTFDPHPLSVLQGNQAAYLLTSTDEKIDLLRSSCVEIAIVIKFTAKFANREADWFIKKVLMQRLNMKRLVIGYDFRFGKGRKGDVTCLEFLGAELGFGVDIIPPVTYVGFPISSTRIRTAILRGDMESAAKMLGRLYSFSGKVVKGEGRGTLLNFPTANLEVEGKNKMLPPAGVYSAIVTVGGKRLRGALYIGGKPTFASDSIGVEVHLPGFHGSLYGKRLVVEVISKIRNEIAFRRIEDLKDAIAKDVERILRSN